MAISTEKELHASERFMLVKLTPGRYIVDDLASAGGSDYSMSFPFEFLSGVKRNGSALTLVTTLSGNDQYTWDGSTLTVRLAAAPDEDTNVLVAFYDLYFTGSQARYAPDDPEAAESTSNPLRQWDPRLLSYPSISQTIRNITEGILSYSNTNLNFANESDYFDQYLTIKDSFNNKNVKIWQCINSIDNIQLIYVGKIKDVNTSNSKLSMSIYDPFSKFSENAYFGDPDYEAIMQRQSYSFPNLNPNDNGKPLPYWTAESNNRVSIIGVNPPVQYLRDASQPICANVDLANPVATNNNRSYYLCRVGPNGLKVVNFGTTVRYLNYGSKARLYKLTGHNLSPLDPFYDGTNYGYVAYVGDDFTYSGNTYNCQIEITSATAYPPSNLATVSTYETPPTIWHDNGTAVSLFYWGPHYSWGWVTTASGNKMIQISLSASGSSPETFWGLSPIDPNSSNLYYRVKPADTFTHAEFIEKVCEDAGIAINSASFTAADAALPANVHVAIPNIGESTYRPISGYIEDVLKSTFGYLTINKDFEAEYHLIDPPSTDGEQISNDYVINGSLSEKIDYQDIKTTIIAKNPHYPVTTGEDGYSRADSYKSRYLHEVDNTLELTHCLDDISGRIDDIAAIKAARKKTYRFDVATQLIDSIIGDDITLTDRSANIKIIDIKKDGSKVSVEADDLGEL